MRRTRLTLHRSASQFVPEWDRDRFWHVENDGVMVGAIVQTGGAEGASYWQWSIQMHGPDLGVRRYVTCSGRTETREEGMVVFRESFDRYLEHVGPDGWARHVEHMVALDAC